MTPSTQALLFITTHKPATRASNAGRIRGEHQAMIDAAKAALLEETGKDTLSEAVKAVMDPRKVM